MNLKRREVLAVGAGAFAAVSFAGTVARAAVEDDIAAFTGGAAVGEGGITLTAPEIAENGNTVPIEVSAPGAAVIAVFAEGNPVPPVAFFKFGPLNPNQAAATRIRLAKSQNVIAIAKMADGSFVRASSAVKVTIGGCGG